MSRHRAFTTTELLASVVILAVLLTLLLPAIAKFRSADLGDQSNARARGILAALIQYGQS